MRLFEILRATLRARRRATRAGRGGRGCDRDGSRVAAVATQPPVTTRGTRRRGSCSPLAASVRARSSSTRAGRHTSVCSGLPLRGVPAAGEPRFLGDYLAEQPMARVGVAVDAELRAEGAENVLVAGAALPGAVTVARGIRRGHRIGERLPRRSARARRDPAPGRERPHERTGAIARRPAPRIDRSLRQVHDLRDPVSGVQRDAAVPRAEVRGPPGRALPHRRRAVGRVVGRLLLRVWHLLAGLPPGSEDRRGQCPGPQQAQAPEGRPAPRPDHHPPDLARSRRHTGGAAGQPVD